MLVKKIRITNKKIQILKIELKLKLIKDNWAFLIFLN